MPRKTRRRIRGFRVSRRRRGTRIRGGNRRYYNGGNIINTIENIRNNPSKFLQEQRENLNNVVTNARQKLNDAVINTKAKFGMTTPSY